MARRTAEEVIREYVENGYELVLKSGDANAVENLRLDYKSNGFDARWWTLRDDEIGKYHVLYAKKRSPRVKSVFTENPITEQTYYHGFQEEKLVPMPVNPKAEGIINDTYGELTVKALREICKNRKIAGYYKMTKQQMIESLQSAC